jgi:alpha-D-ribose 1-methylphosphonate 5-triphosphate synthase subunit PhnL
LSFSIEEGELLGIVGPSGIGKSSILKCIFRTYLPSAGEIRFQSEMFGAVDLASASERLINRLRQREIGYVSQFLKVIPRVAVADIVAERWLEAGLPADEAGRQARDILARLHIPRPLWEAYPATFSGGEQQRVNLARAMVVRPRLLILDEPTASLDGAAKARVLELILEMKRQGTAMIGVFHDLEFMNQAADRVLDLAAWSDNGRKDERN